LVVKFEKSQLSKVLPNKIASKWQMTCLPVNASVFVRLAGKMLQCSLPCVLVAQNNLHVHSSPPLRHNSLFRPPSRHPPSNR
jgi:hypothetical protein